MRMCFDLANRPLRSNITIQLYRIYIKTLIYSTLNFDVQSYLHPTVALLTGQMTGCC